MALLHSGTLEILLTTVIDLLHTRVVSCDGVYDIDTRLTLGRMLDNLCVLCRACTHVVHLDSRIGPLVFYERLWRQAQAPSSARPCLFDFVPQSVSVFGSNATTSLPLNMIDYIKSDRFCSMNIINMVIRMCSRCDTMTATRIQRLKLKISEETRTDIHYCQVVLSQTQLFMDAVLQHRGKQWFSVCANRMCARRFIVHAKTDLCTGGPSVQNRLQPLRNDQWERIVPAPSYKQDAARFCSSECARQWWSHIALYEKAVQYFYDFDTANAWESTVFGDVNFSQSTAVAASRNVCNVIREMRRFVRKGSCCLTAHDVHQVESIFVSRCNVVIGICTAQSIVRRCPSLSRHARRVTTATVVDRICRLYRSNPCRKIVVPARSLNYSAAFLRSIKKNIFRLVSTD